MSRSARVYDVETKLSDLLDHARKGEDVVVAESGRPVARVVLIDEPGPKGPRKFGQNLLGITFISPDFDEPAFSDRELDEMGL
jgi:antitoxin (DNA-binding transcriptional repressor) of toxin-antitoxin stability system